MNNTTCLPVVESKIMLGRGETDTIRIPKRLREYIGVEIGDTLVVSNGQAMFVEDVLSEDGARSGGTSAFVARVDKTLTATSILDIAPMAPNTLTIGCDPEFVLIDTTDGTVVNADSIFSGKGKLGCDSGLAEIRPDPHTNPAAVVENIRSLIYNAKEKTNLLPLACSVYKGWLAGFHIHFGFPKPVLLHATPNTIEFIENTILALDYLVGIPAMLRDTADGRRLSGAEYGRPGDYRISEHTLEYRVPGAFHLRSPRYTLEMLTAAYVVVEDILGRGQLANKYWSDISSFFSREHFSEVYKLPSKNDISAMLISEDRSKARSEVEKITAVFREVLYGYKNNEEVIESFMAADSKESPFIFDNWLV